MTAECLNNKLGINLKEIYYIERSTSFTKECLNLWTFKKEDSVLGIASGRYLFKNEKAYSCKIILYTSTKCEFSREEIFTTTIEIAEMLIKAYNLFNLKECSIEKHEYNVSKSSIYTPEIYKASELIKEKYKNLFNILERTRDIIQHELFSAFNRGPYFAYISECRYDGGKGLLNIKPSVTISLEERRKISESEFNKFKENIEEIINLIKKPVFLWDFIERIDDEIEQTYKKWKI